jgi:hypothetical protein
MMNRGVCEGIDVLQNSVGAIIGVGVAFLLLRIERSREETDLNSRHGGLSKI